MSPYLPCKTLVSIALVSQCAALDWSSEALLYLTYIEGARKPKRSLSYCSHHTKSSATVVFSAMRVFAVWNRSYLWALASLILGLVPVMTNLVQIAFLERSLSAYYSSCLTVQQYPRHIRLHWRASLRVRRLCERSPVNRFLYVSARIVGLHMTNLGTDVSTLVGKLKSILLY